MAKYFEKFKIVKYNGFTAINIMERTAILNGIFGNRYAFYPYTVKNGMRAEQVADKYYGSPHYVWLVYFSNNIIDPYHEWVMDNETFNNFITDKYGSIQEAKSQIVKYRVNWYDDSTTLSVSQYNGLNGTLKKYWTPRYNAYDVPTSYVRKPLDLSVSNLDNIPDIEKSYWSSVSSYDIEEESNNDKAHIRLLDSKLATIAEKNLRDLMKR